MLGVFVVCGTAACTTPSSVLADVASTTSSPPAATSSTSGPAPTTGGTPAPAGSTSDPATQTSYTLPADMDAATRRMVDAYLAWETGYRRSMAAARLDAAVTAYGSGQAVTVAQTTVSYLQSHHGTLVGPWQLTLRDARASGRTGSLRVCIAGGSEVYPDRTSALAGPTAETVTMNDVGVGWRVTGYDQGKQGCS